MAPCGVGVIMIGLVIRFKIGKRRFSRRGMTGLEWFPSYGQAIITKLIEGLFMIIAKLLILSGILFILGASL